MLVCADWILVLRNLCLSVHHCLRLKYMSISYMLRLILTDEEDRNVYNIKRYMLGSIGLVVLDTRTMIKPVPYYYVYQSIFFLLGTGGKLFWSIWQAKCIFLDVTPFLFNSDTSISKLICICYTMICAKIRPIITYAMLTIDRHLRRKDIHF